MTPGSRSAEPVERLRKGQTAQAGGTEKILKPREGVPNDRTARWVDCMRVPSMLLLPRARHGKWAVVALALVAILACAGCDKSPESADIPSQTYTSRFNLVGKAAGSLKGQVVYPSAYSQHSAPFFLNDVQLSTLPDGRFWVRSIPAGEHRLSLYVPGFESIVRLVRIGGNQLTDAQALVLKPAWGSLVGRVVTDDGRSAAGATVRLEPYGLIGATDRDGIFRFMGIGGGEHVLEVQCAGCKSEQLVVRLQANEERNLGNLTVHRRADTAVESVQLVREAAGG